MTDSDSDNELDCRECNKDLYCLGCMRNQVDTLENEILIKKDQWNDAISTPIKDKKIQTLRLDNCDLGIKLAKVEVLIISNIIEPTLSGCMFKKYLEKWEELMLMYMELGSDGVQAGCWEEGDYLEQCANAVSHRQKIIERCEIGKKRSREEWDDMMGSKDWLG
jgi:hypothetical protein